MGTYLNLLGHATHFIIDNFGNTMEIFKGVHKYPDEIAEKFPSVFQPVEDYEIFVVFDENDEIDEEYTDDDFDDIIEICDCGEDDGCDLCPEEDEIEASVEFDEEDDDEFFDEICECDGECEECKCDGDFDDLKELEELLDDEPEDQPETPDEVGDTDEEVMIDTILNKEMAEKIDWDSVENMVKTMEKDDIFLYAEDYFSIKLDKRKSSENMIKDLKAGIDELNEKI